MTDDSTTTIPGIEDWQHWALVMARANQMMMEAWADNLDKASHMPGFGLTQPPTNAADPMQWMSAGADAALTEEHRAELADAGFRVESVELDGIEVAGGSLRCCVAEIF